MSEHRPRPRPKPQPQPQPQPQQLRLRLAHPHPEQGGAGEEDWSSITDPRERRRIQNRLSQRNHRASLKKRVEDLEKRLAASDPEEPQGALSPANSDSNSVESSLSTLCRTDAILVNHPGGHRGGTPVHRGLALTQERHVVLAGETSPPFPTYPQVVDKDVQHLPNLNEIDDLAFFGTYPMSPIESSLGPLGHSQDPNGASSVYSAAAQRPEGSEGKSTLHVAVEHGHLRIITLILESGISINCRDDSDQTPLHLAAKGHWPGVTELLLARGAELHCKDSQGRTPLHVAAQADNEVSLRSLLAKHPSQVDCKDASGKTPLYYAIESSNERMVQLLLEEGADVHVVARVA